MRLDYRHLKPYRDYQYSRMLGRRLLVLKVLIIAGFVLYGGVFWYLQVVQGGEYRRKAEDNRLRQQIQRPVRGPIRDNHGALLATNRPSFSVRLDRQRCEDPLAVIDALSDRLGVDPGPIRELYERQKERPRFLPVLLMPDVGLETAARIEAQSLELPAVDVVVEAKRYYPLGAAAAHVLGYTGEATRDEVRRGAPNLLPGDRVGRIGVERAWDDFLRGRHGLVLEEVNASGRPLMVVAAKRPVRHGQTLTTTLDAAMQADLARAFGDHAGAAVFLDPRSGAVRALYSAPSYDPNLFAGRVSSATWKALREDPSRPLQNRAVAGVYSPGSTFKLIVAAAALEEGVLEPGEEIFCGGQARFYGQVRHCHRRWGHGKIGLQEAIERSCNIFFYTLGQRLGIEAIEKWSRRFGLGSATGLDLGGEVSGLVPSNEWKMRTRGEPWFPGETISVAIGQGPLNVTPIQLAVQAAVIANGGLRVRPFLRQREGAAPEPIGLSPEVIRELTRAMVAVVQGEGGTAHKARIPGVVLAGKTGTAQVVALDAENDPGDHALFIGFGPLPDPELAWAVIVEHGGHGGELSAPIVREVVRGYLERQGRLAPTAPRQVARRRGDDGL